MAESSPEPDQEHALLKYLGKAVHLFIVALGVILFILVTYVDALKGPYASPLLLNLSAGLMLTGLIFLLVSQFGFNLDVQRQRGLAAITNQLSQTLDTIERLKVLEDCDLIRYRHQIKFTPPQEWYEHIEKAERDISLMSPSLRSWFEDRNFMRQLLARKAIHGTKIRFIIMAGENKIGTAIASLTGTRADVDFYTEEALKKNEDEIRKLITEVNEEIQKISKGECKNYVELRKVLSTPIFVKTEFFDEILHWSFFGYNLDGKLAPSFWCKKVDHGTSPGLYQILRAEFDTIWRESTISVEIDVAPRSKGDDNLGADIPQRT